MSRHFLDRLFLRVASAFGAYVCRNRKKSWCQHLCRYADQFRYSYENVNFDMDSNGETRVIEIARCLSPVTVFDVGANIGQWSLRFAKLHPDSSIHTFEPVPATFEKLKANTSETNIFRHNNFGLSNCRESVTLHSTDTIEFDSATTAYPIHGMAFHDQYYSTSLDCSFEKGADYMEENGISAIDFMKIDVEGMEYKVLEGFGDLIERARAVQFEYGVFNISSRALLRDLCAFFEKHGFVVGKIYPQHVEFFSYHFDRENFLGNNFIAVKKEESGYIQALAAE